MLTPDYLDTLPDALVSLWQQVEDDILRDIARRIGKLADGDAPTETAAWQLWRYQQAQALHQDVVSLLARYSGKSDAEIRRILQAAGTETLAADDALYQALGFSPSDINSSPALLNLLNAGYRQTAGTWQNLTATTANTVTRQFENALDRAWLQTGSGAFDYKTAIKRAVDGLAADGLKAVTYPSGHTDTLEVAVRRAVLTGVNQTAAKLQLARAEEMGCEFVEVTAHGGARSDGSRGPADHAWWQGKVYHIGGDVWLDGVFYPDFATATGYGTGEGLCGWNCRHNFFPFWPGISKRNYTDAALEKLNVRDITYQGRLYTRYEISQMQRALERKVRSAKRKYLAEDAAGLDTGAAAVKLKAARQSLVQFVQATGGRQDSARESVSGFGRSAAGKATWAARKKGYVEMTRKAGYTHQKTTARGTKVISQPLYNKLTSPIERAGGLVLRGTPDVEEHLQKQGATALQVGDIIMFRSDATISDVLEETHHFWQNRRGMNDDKPIDIRTALNEIDAKEYLINVAEKYKIPVDETDLTKQQLEYYKNMLKELEGKK